MNDCEVDFTVIFERTKTGHGSKLMKPESVLAFLRFCRERGWFIRSMEAFEVEDGLEYLDLGFSMLGLAYKESAAQNASELSEYCREILEKAIGSSKDYLFQVWIDEGECF